MSAPLDSSDFEQSVLSASRKCAVCDWMVAHLQQLADEEAAAGTSYEMGWRLKGDGTRVAKRVTWAQSELGFGAAIEAACAPGSDHSDDDETSTPLHQLVQVAMGDELRLRVPKDAGERDHTLRDESFELFQSSCHEFVFEDEDALDAIRDQSFSETKKGLSPGVQMAREVCTARAKVCPKERWQRWYGPDASVDAQVLVHHVPRATESYLENLQKLQNDNNANFADGRPSTSAVAGWMCAQCFPL